MNYFYCSLSNTYYMLCNKLKDLYLVRSSSTGLYHELTERQLANLIPVEETHNIVDKQKDLLAYLEDREQVRIVHLVRPYYDN